MRSEEKKERGMIKMRKIWNFNYEMKLVPDKLEEFRNLILDMGLMMHFDGGILYIHYEGAVIPVDIRSGNIRDAIKKLIKHGVPIIGIISPDGVQEYIIYQRGV